MSNPSYLLEPASLNWEEGTPSSNTFEDIYWHRNQALQEKQYVFVDSVKRQLGEAAESDNLQYTVAELGFGFGINCLLTAEFWRSLPTTSQLNLVSFEKYPVPIADLRQLLSGYNFSFTQTLLDQYPPSYRGQHVIWLADNIRLLLVLDDAERGLANLDAEVDHWYLDGFAPSRNPELWDASTMRRVFAHCRQGAAVSTYSAAGHVRRALERSGFLVEKRPGYGNKREMLSAAAPGQWTPKQKLRDTVAVIGGGIAGHYCAEALHRRGQPFRLIDSGKPGASKVPQLSVFPQLAVEPEAKYRFSLVASQYMHHSRGFYHDGMNWQPRSPEEGERLRQIAELFPDDMIETLPDGSLNYHLAGWLSSRDLFEELSLEFEQQNIQDIDWRGTWHCHNSKGEIVASSEQLIVATGFDRQLIDPALNIRAIRGQAISIKSTNLPGILNSHVTLFPGYQGRSVVSGTYARSDDLTPRDADTSDLLSAATSLHAIDTSEVEPWVGVRAVSRDRLPMIGPMPDWQAVAEVNRLSALTCYVPGLHVCTAFGSRGATHARLCAEHVVSKLLGEPAALALEHQWMLSPARFELRDRQSN